MNSYKNCTDPDLLLSLSNSHAEKQDHSSAVDLAVQALELNPSKNTKHSLLERISVSGFYSSDEQHKLLGADACEKIATDKNQSWHVRNLARQNSTYYAKSSTDLMPKTIIKEVDFVPNYDYAPMNPSITSHNGNLWMIQRSVNYRIRPDGSYDMRGDNAIRTKNYLLQLDDDLNVINSEEILPPKNLPDPLYNLVVGWEDCRLFYWNNEPWCTATVRELNPDGYCEIVLSRIAKDENDNLRFTDYRVIKPNFCPLQHEKNWMPIITKDGLYFLYSNDPVQVIDPKGNLLLSKVTHFASDSFRGGGNLVSYKDGWLGLIHESHNMPSGPRRYMHRFVWYNAIGKLCLISPAFYLKNLGIEFSAGLAQHPTRSEVIASFGIHDRSSWLATFSHEDIDNILSAPSKVDSKVNYNLATTMWLSEQTNRTLKDLESANKCTDLLNLANFPVSTSPWKNWENMLSVWHTGLNTETSEPVLVIKPDPSQDYYRMMQELGYENVTQNVFPLDKVEFEDNYYGFISCLSWLQPDMNHEEFLKTISRILKSNGRMFITLYYLPYLYNSHKLVFSEKMVNDFLDVAKKFNLIAETQVLTGVKDKIVKLSETECTLINILLKKQ